MAGPVGEGGRVRQWTRGFWRYLLRAVRHSGDERDDVLLQLKGTAAAVAAWSLASWLLSPNVTTFAPFTSLLALHGTVYRSLGQSVRYLGAVVAGVLLAEVFGSTAGVHAWSLAVLMLVALAVGKLQTLGAQRIQVPVTALFAFTAGTGSVGYSLELGASVLIGVGCGMAVTVFLAPPARYRNAEEAVAQLSARVCDLLTDISRTLRESTPTAAQTKEWAESAARVQLAARQARATVESGHENARLNPRRMLTRGSRALPDYHSVVNTLERVGDQTRSIARGLAYAAHSDHYETLASDFLTPYAGLLEATARVAEQFTSSDKDAGPEQLGAGVDRARERYSDLSARSSREHLDAPGEWPLYGTLLTDAYRILDEFDRSGSQTTS